MIHSTLSGFKISRIFLFFPFLLIIGDLPDSPFGAPKGCVLILSQHGSHTHKMQPIKPSMCIDMGSLTSRYLSGIWVPFDRWSGAQVKVDAEGRECGKGRKMRLKEKPGCANWDRKSVALSPGLTHIRIIYEALLDSQILPQTYWIRIYQHRTSASECKNLPMDSNVQLYLWSTGK